jgi:hypothetical protein
MIDAATLAELLAADYLPTGWQPDPKPWRIKAEVHIRYRMLRHEALVSPWVETAPPNAWVMPIDREVLGAPFDRVALVGNEPPLETARGLAVRFRRRKRVKSEVWRSPIRDSSSSTLEMGDLADRPLAGAPPGW